MLTDVTLGTMTWGAQNSESEAHAQLDLAFERGVIGIDSAELYPSPPQAETQGLTERYIASWIASRGGASFRDKLVLASKVLGTSPGAFPWIRGENRRVDRANIREAIHGILERLNTDYIDLFQIHVPDRYTPVFGASMYRVELEREATSFEEQIEAMAELIREGKIRHYGLSNETAWGVAQFDAVARANGLPRPASIQNSYCLLNRDFETHLAEACAPSNANVGLMAYSPLAGGILTGKYLGGKLPKGARYSAFPQFMTRYASEPCVKAVQTYQTVAKEAGLSLAELSLAWCRQQWFASTTVIGATSIAQLEENLNAFTLELDQSVIDAVNEVHREIRNPART